LIEITPAEESQILAQREARKIRQSGGYGPAPQLGQQEASLLDQLAALNEARLCAPYAPILRSLVSDPIGRFERTHT
jgi:hypothetical protein